MSSARQMLLTVPVGISRCRGTAVDFFRSAIDVERVLFPLAHEFAAELFEMLN